VRFSRTGLLGIARLVREHSYKKRQAALGALTLKLPAGKKRQLLMMATLLNPRQ